MSTKLASIPIPATGAAAGRLVAVTAAHWFTGVSSRAAGARIVRLAPRYATPAGETLHAAPPPEASAPPIDLMRYGL
jgi:hypothetical protein